MDTKDAIQEEVFKNYIAALEEFNVAMEKLVTEFIRIRQYIAVFGGKEIEEQLEKSEELKAILKNINKNTNTNKIINAIIQNND